MSKTERFINLIAMLLEAKRPVTLDQIRASIPGYGQDSMASFKRMFERDKKELREMGVPIRVEPVDALGEEMGYRIPKEEYYLPEVEFTPEERVALLLVNRLSSEAVTPLSREAQSALLKLSPDLGDGSRLGRPGSPQLRFSSPAEPVEDLSRLWEAAVCRRRVRFVYRSLSGKRAQKRELDPYGLYFDRGAWYVVGFCHLRKEVRSFRVSRIAAGVEFAAEDTGSPDFERPPGFRLAEHSRILPWEFEEGEEFEATVLFSPKVAWLVERDLGDVYPFEPQEDGGGTLRVTVRNVDGFIDWLLSFAEEAEVLSPEILREKVVSHLQRIAERLGVTGVAEQADRITRLLSLIPYVLKHQGVSLKELSEVFETSQEQLVRDLQTIFLCGQPDYTPADLIEVDFDEDRVSIRMADYFARPLRFTPSELAGLHLACGALARLSGSPASSALDSAMDKIEKALGVAPGSLRDIGESVEIHPLGLEQAVLAELTQACEECRVLEMEYYTYGRGALTRRRIHPLSLEFGMGHWYLRAWDERSEEVRVFRVDRIKELKATKESFTLRRRRGRPNPWAPRWRERSRLAAVLSALARWAREQRVFSEAKEEKGYLVCTLRTDSLEWLERELLRYGAEVEILSPPELKERLRARVEKVLSIYR